MHEGGTTNNAAKSTKKRHTQRRAKSCPFGAVAMMGAAGEGDGGLFLVAQRM